MDPGCLSHFLHQFESFNIYSSGNKTWILMMMMMMMIWLIRRCRSSGRGDPHTQLSDRTHQHTCHQSTNGPCSVSAPVLHPVSCPPEIMYSSFPASSHPNLFPFLLSICVPVGSEHLDLLSSCWADTDPSGLIKGGDVGS